MRLYNKIHKARNGFYYNNPYNHAMSAAMIPLTGAMGYATGSGIAAGMGFDVPTQKRFGRMSLANNLMTGTGKFRNEIWKSRELAENIKNKSLEDYRYPLFDPYVYEMESSTPRSGYGQHGGLMLQSGTPMMMSNASYTKGNYSRRPYNSNYTTFDKEFVKNLDKSGDFRMLKRNFGGVVGNAAYSIEEGQGKYVKAGDAFRGIGDTNHLSILNREYHPIKGNRIGSNKRNNYMATLSGANHPREQYNKTFGAKYQSGGKVRSDESISRQDYDNLKLWNSRITPEQRQYILDNPKQYKKLHDALFAYEAGKKIYESGGKIPKAQNGIYHDNLNNTFQDSLKLYNAYTFQRENMHEGYDAFLRNNALQVGLPTESYKETWEKEKGKPGEREYYHEEDKKSDFEKWNGPERPEESIPPSPEEQPIVDYYDSLGLTSDFAAGRHSSPDLWHRTINPIGLYHDGRALSPIYKKPYGAPGWTPAPPPLQSLTPTGLASHVTPNIFSNDSIRLPGEPAHGKWYINPNTGRKTYYNENPIRYNWRGEKYKIGGRLPKAQNGDYIYESGGKKKIIKAQNGDYIPDIPVGDNLPEVTVNELYLPDIDANKYKPGICRTKNCSEYTTTALANILGVTRDRVEPIVAEDAWYKRDKVLRSGGEDIWTVNKGNKIDSDKLQVGDFVSLLYNNKAANTEELEDPPINLMGNRKESPYNFGKTPHHSGIIIGRNPKTGNALVQHNIDGTLRVNEIGSNNMAGVFNVTSIFRPPQTIGYDFENRKKYDKRTKDVIESYENPTIYAKEVESYPELSEAYRNIKSNLGKNLRLTSDEMDRIYSNLIGVGAQESNLYNRATRKELGNTIFYDLFDKGKQRFTESLPSRENRRLKKIRKSLSERPKLADILRNNNEPRYLNWEAEMLAAKLAEEEGIKFKKALKRFKLKDNPERVTPKSKGIFKQKYEDEPLMNSLRARKGKNTREELDLINAIGLYADNLKTAKRLHEDLPEEVYHKIATLAHNSPEKAFDRRFIDFYLMGIDNPDTERFSSDYLDEVARYRKNILDDETFKYGGQLPKAQNGVKVPTRKSYEDLRKWRKSLSDEQVQHMFMQGKGRDYDALKSYEAGRRKYAPTQQENLEASYSMEAPVVTTRRKPRRDISIYGDVASPVRKDITENIRQGRDEFAGRAMELVNYPTQIPQSLMVEAIEKGRGNPYNRMNAFTLGAQRSPSQIWDIQNPYVAMLVDTLVDPLAGLTGVKPKTVTRNARFYDAVGRDFLKSKSNRKAYKELFPKLLEKKINSTRINNERALATELELHQNKLAYESMLEETLDRLNNQKPRTYRNLLWDEFKGNIFDPEFQDLYMGSAGVFYPSKDRIYVKSRRPLVKVEGTAIHELSHAEDPMSFLIAPGGPRIMDIGDSKWSMFNRYRNDPRVRIYQDLALPRTETPNVIKHNNSGKVFDHYEYYTLPTEIRARLNEVAYANNKQLHNVTTQDVLNSDIWSVQQMLPYIDKKALERLLKSPHNYKSGGQLPKAQNGLVNYLPGIPIGESLPEVTVSATRPWYTDPLIQLNRSMEMHRDSMPSTAMHPDAIPAAAALDLLDRTLIYPAEVAQAALAETMIGSDQNHPLNRTNPANYKNAIYRDRMRTPADALMLRNPTARGAANFVMNPANFVGAGAFKSVGTKALKKGVKKPTRVDDLFEENINNINDALNTRGISLRESLERGEDITDVISTIRREVDYNIPNTVIDVDRISPTKLAVKRNSLRNEADFTDEKLTGVISKALPKVFDILPAPKKGFSAEDKEFLRLLHKRVYDELDMSPKEMAKLSERSNYKPGVLRGKFDDVVGNLMERHYKDPFEDVFWSTNDALNFLFASPGERYGVSNRIRQSLKNLDNLKSGQSTVTALNLSSDSGLLEAKALPRLLDKVTPSFEGFSKLSDIGFASRYISPEKIAGEINKHITKANKKHNLNLPKAKVFGRSVMLPRFKYTKKKHGGLLPKAQNGDLVDPSNTAIAKVIMNRNRDKEFVDRAFNPYKYPNKIRRTKDGIETHKMAWGFDDKGRARMYPTIFNENRESIVVPNNVADWMSRKGYKIASGISNKLKSGGYLPKAQNGDFVYEGGELPEITVTPEDNTIPWWYRPAHEVNKRLLKAVPYVKEAGLSMIPGREAYLNLRKGDYRGAAASLMPRRGGNPIDVLMREAVRGGEGFGIRVLGDFATEPLEVGLELLGAKGVGKGVGKGVKKMVRKEAKEFISKIKSGENALDLKSFVAGIDKLSVKESTELRKILEKRHQRIKDDYDSGHANYDDLKDTKLKLKLVSRSEENKYNKSFKGKLDKKVKSSKEKIDELIDEVKLKKLQFNYKLVEPINLTLRDAKNLKSIDSKLFSELGDRVDLEHFREDYFKNLPLPVRLRFALASRSGDPVFNPFVKKLSKEVELLGRLNNPDKAGLVTDWNFDHSLHSLESQKRHLFDLERLRNRSVFSDRDYELMDAYTKGYDRMLNSVESPILKRRFKPIINEFNELVSKGNIGSNALGEVLRTDRDFVIPYVLRNNKLIKNIPLSKLEEGDIYSTGKRNLSASYDTGNPFGIGLQRRLSFEEDTPALIFNLQRVGQYPRETEALLGRSAFKVVKPGSKSIAGQHKVLSKSDMEDFNKMVENKILKDKVVERILQGSALGAGIYGAKSLYGYNQGVDRTEYYKELERRKKLSETNNIKQQGGQIPTSNLGLYEYPNQPVRVPSNRITMRGIDYPVMAYPDNDMPVMMNPNSEYYFPNSSEVLEVPVKQKVTLDDVLSSFGF